MTPIQNLSYPIAFTKMSGTGNDFIIVDNRAGLIPGAAASEFARRVCRRKFSAGADGLILIENSHQADFQWQFYNADGSVAEMCGNGARCAARFAYAKKIAPASMRFLTLAGIIEATIIGDAVKVKLTEPTNLQLGQELDTAGTVRTVHFVNTGVPHVVCFVADIAATDVVALGRPIRQHVRYQPAGTNVNFVGISGNGLMVRTYERGVEDETMACGTGAVASAAIGALLGHVSSPVPVTTSGGEQLVIHFEVEPPRGTIREVYLEGPANFIYDGQMHHEALS